jgi:hypothetical protein
MANQTDKLPAGKAGEGTNMTATSSDTTAGATASGNVPVAAPTDAKPGDPQGGSIGAPDLAGQQNEAAKADQKYNRGYALKVTKKGHVHAGIEVKKGATIMLDIAEYRWALDNKIGEPGNAEDAGFDVDSKGMVLKPENEPTLEELEAKARGNKQSEE